MRDLLGKNMKFFEVIFFEEYRNIQFNLNLLQVLSNWDVNCNTLKNVFVQEGAIKDIVCAVD